MYQSIFEKCASYIPNFPKMRRSLVGSAIKGIRVDKGIRQIDFAKTVGINESTLKSIENDHQQATTVDNLEKCAHALDATVEELILLGRERDPANYFVFKKSAPTPIKGIRKRKRAPEEWHQSMRIQFKDFDVTPCSPPIDTKKDFFFIRINLPPKRAVERLRLESHQQVLGFISAGFNIKIDYAQKYTTLTGNQGFSLDGFYPHTIINEDEDTAAVIYLLTRIPKVSQKIAEFIEKPAAHKKSESIDVSLGVRRLREYKSERLGRVLPIQHLADMTEGLDRFKLEKLMRLKKDSSVIYWEKIEDLLAAADVSMEQFLKWCRNQEDKPIDTLIAPERSFIHYTYQGLKFHSATPPEGSEFFLGEFMIEGRSAPTKKSWERKNKAMISIFVEEGELEVSVGKSRTPLPILKGESIYFDGNLGYRLRNPGEKQARGFFATYPAIRV